MKKGIISKIVIIVLVIAIFILTLSTCGKKKEAEEPAPEAPVEEVKEEPAEEPAEPEILEKGFINPLTGEETVEDISGNRPYAVMVNNIKNAQPQVGVSQADLLYEMLVEGGITRSLAVFQDITDAPVVGSVRSSRHYYIGIAMGHDAIYVHAGGSPYAYDFMSSHKTDHIDGVKGSGETFYRDEWRSSNLGYEHSMMLDTTLLPQYLIDHKLDGQHKEDYECSLQFTDKAVTSAGEAADNVDVNFSNYKGTYFTYDSSDKLYHAKQYDADYIDGGNDEQVKVKNLLVVFAEMSNIPGDDKGRLDAEFTGEGTGYYACEGKYIPIKWERTDDESEFKYFTEDGKALELCTGNSYICIVDIGNTVDFH